MKIMASIQARNIIQIGIDSSMFNLSSTFITGFGGNGSFFLNMKYYSSVANLIVIFNSV